MVTTYLFWRPSTSQLQTTASAQYFINGSQDTIIATTNRNTWDMVSSQQPFPTCFLARAIACSLRVGIAKWRPNRFIFYLVDLDRKSRLTRKTQKVNLLILKLKKTAEDSIFLLYLYIPQENILALMLFTIYPNDRPSTFTQNIFSMPMV